MNSPVIFLKNIYLFYCLFGAVLVGCTSTTEFTTSQLASEELTKIPTSLPLASLTSTATGTPTITEVPESPFLLTPLPTLSVEEARDYVKYLLREDPDCILPCWMGITPGETTIEEALQFSSTFALDIKFSDDYQYFSILYEMDEKVEGAGQQFTGGIAQLWTDIRVNNGIIDYLRGDTRGGEQRYQFAEVLNRYGPPEEIWISIRQGGEGPAGIGFMHFFYVRLGLDLYFDIVPIEITDNTLEFCLTELGVEVQAWDPANEYTFEDRVGSDLLHLYSPLSDATKFTVEEFYTTFKDNKVVCLTTPINIW